MPEGVIVGGWSYVVAAYAISTIALALYGVVLLRSVRKAEREEISNDD